MIILLRLKKNRGARIQVWPWELRAFIKNNNLNDSLLAAGCSSFDIPTEGVSVFQEIFEFITTTPAEVGENDLRKAERLEAGRQRREMWENIMINPKDKKYFKNARRLVLKVRGVLYHCVRKAGEFFEYFEY